MKPAIPDIAWHQSQARSCWGCGCMICAIAYRGIAAAALEDATFVGVGCRSMTVVLVAVDTGPYSEELDAAISQAMQARDTEAADTIAGGWIRVPSPGSPRTVVGWAIAPPGTAIRPICPLARRLP